MDFTDDGLSRYQLYGSLSKATDPFNNTIQFQTRCLVTSAVYQFV